MTRRSHIPLKTQLAAALVQIGGIPYDDAKAMTADQVISLFHRDHYPRRKEDGGSDEHYNLHWKFIGAHREKTAKVDRPQSAKGKRLRDEQENFRRRLLAKDRGERQPQSRWPKRKMQSRNTFKRSAELARQSAD